MLDPLGRRRGAGRPALGTGSVVQDLLAAGAHIDAVGGETSWTALNGAAGYSNVVKILVEAGANINLLDNKGHSAADYARLKGRNAVDAYLVASARLAAAAAKDAQEQAAAEAAEQQAFAELMLEEGEVEREKQTGGKAMGKGKAKGGK